MDQSSRNVEVEMGAVARSSRCIECSMPFCKPQSCPLKIGGSFQLAFNNTIREFGFERIKKFVARCSSDRSSFCLMLALSPPIKEIVFDFENYLHTRPSFDWKWEKEIHEEDSPEPCGFL